MAKHLLSHAFLLVQQKNNTIVLKVTMLPESKIFTNPLLGLTLHLSGHDYLKICFLQEKLLLAGGLL